MHVLRPVKDSTVFDPVNHEGQIKVRGMTKEDPSKQTHYPCRHIPNDKAATTLSRRKIRQKAKKKSNQILKQNKT